MSVTLYETLAVAVIAGQAEPAVVTAYRDTRDAKWVTLSPPVEAVALGRAVGVSDGGARLDGGVTLALSSRIDYVGAVRVVIGADPEVAWEVARREIIGGTLTLELERVVERGVL